MKCLFTVALSLMAFASYADGQSQDCPSPQGCVLITREAALKALDDADKVKAQEAEIKVKDQAIAGLKTELNNVRVEFARASGELSGLKQNAVQDRAIIEILLKNARPKKFGLINLF